MDYTKSASGHVMLNLCFCSQWDLDDTQWILVRPGCETSMHYFSCLGGPGVLSIKSTPRHVTPNLCSCIWWDLWVT
jgi:hypothetical protein